MYSLKSKIEVLDIFKHFYVIIETQASKSKVIRSDGGTEDVNNLFEDYGPKTFITR